jgi:site-specific recombinase XerC
LQQVRGVAASTVNVSLAALRAMAMWCMETGELREDPSAQVRFLDLVEQPPHWLTRADLHKLLAEFERSINDAMARDNVERTRQAVRDLAAASLMAGAGLRISEVVQLDVDDIEIRERSGSVLVRNGKGRKQRSVPLGQPLRIALHNWLSHRGGSQGGALFVSQKGGRITARQLQRVFRETARRAGLVDVTPHSLRHTFVKNVVKRSGDLAIAQQLAGHRRIQTTARYAAPGNDELVAAAEGALA